MKKGNRVLAMFLATVMLVTSIAWDFSDASEAEAAETTTTITEAEHSGLINFVDVDVSTLNDRFSSTRLVETTYAYDGEVDQPVENHWMSTRTVKNDSGVEKTIEGIKPTSHRNDKRHNLLKYNDTYENFRLSVKMTWSTNVGIILGAKYTYGLATATDAIMIYTSGGKIVVRGAIDNSEAVEEGASSTLAKGTNQCTMTLASNIYEQEETINVRMEDGVLNVWVENYNQMLSVKVADTYPQQSNISLWSMGYNNTNSFKSFEVRNLNLEGYYDFEHVDENTLESDFTATQYLNSDNSLVGESEQEVSALWYSGRMATSGDLSLKSTTVGMRPLVSVTSTYNHLLNYQQRYRDFEATIEMYVGSNMGIIIGEETTYPTSSTSPAIVLWFTENKIGLKGAIDYENARVSGENAAWSGASASSLFTYSDSNFTNGGVYELNVKMVDGTLTVWVTDYDAVLTVDVTSDYPMASTLALWGRGYGSTAGSFKSLTIQSLNESYFDFVNEEVATLNDAFTSTQLDEANSYAIREGEQDQVVEKHWSSDITTIPGIKPKTVRAVANGKGYYHLLKYNEAYKNFELSVELRWGTNIGIVLGDAYVYPLADTTNALMISPDTRGNEYKKLRVRGAIDGSKAEAVGTLGTTESDGDTISYFQVSDTSLGNSMQRINIKMEDRVLTISVEGYDEVYTVNVGDTYPEGTNISLWAIGYDNDISFGDFYIKNLDDTYVNFENIDLTDADDQAKINAEFSSTRLVNSSPYAIDGEVDQAVENHWSTDATLTSDPDTVNVPGIKPNIKRNDNPNPRFSLLKYNKAYNNFELSVKLVWGTNIGIVLGDAYTYPLATAENAILIIPDTANYARLKVRGAIDQTKATVEGTLAKCEKTSGQCLLHVANASKDVQNTVKTINIKMENGLLTVWVDGIDEVLTVSVSTTYPLLESNISLWAYGYDNNISFKSFAVSELQLPGNTGTVVDVETDDGRYTSFDKVDISVLEEKEFSATRFNISDGYSLDGDVNQPVSSYWAAGFDVLSDNDGLKSNALHTDSKMTVLNTPYAYENFRVSAEIYWGANTGIILGEKNVYPAGTSTTTSVRIYFNEDKLQLVGGGFDFDSVKVLGGTATWNPTLLETNEVGIFKPASDYTREVGAVYKLNVEMIDGVFTIWLDGCEGVLTVKASDAFVEAANKTIALQSRGFDGDCGGLKSLTVKELTGDIVIPYSAEDFKAFRAEDGNHTAPTYKGYLFAGWFTDSACELKTAIPTSATSVEEETVYAKFVPRYILTVKAQVSAELLDTNLQNDETGNIRFATTVDSLNYAQVGFNVSYDKDGDGEATTVPSVSNEVYSVLKAIGGITYQPTDFCKSSQYFKACTVRKVGESYYSLEFTVTPFWKTLDGTVVEGDTVVKTINQGIDSKFLNGKTALFVGDSIQNGDNYLNDEYEMRQAKAWYQRLARYGMVTQEVANQGAALTNTATSGRTQIVKQLDNAEVKDSYDFVILEGGVNDVLIDQDVQSGTDITIDWGTINEDPNATFSDDNIAGAMQALIKTTQEKFPNATIVYIINHYFRASEENMKNYVAMIKAACRVHDISYVDLSDTEAYPILEPLSYKGSSYIPDNLHPNAAGYDLSTPVIATHLRKLVTGQLVDTVYVASTGTDKTGYGTADAPYATLNYAVAQVEDGGTIYVQDMLTCTNGEGTNKFSLGGYGFETDANVESDTNKIEKVNHKQVTIAGATTEAKLDFSSVSYVFLNESVILEDIQVAWPTLNSISRIMAEGNTFIIKESITQVGSVEPILVAGSHYHSIEKTDLRVYGGTYKMIVGGQIRGFEVGETNVVVGGKVNEAIDLSDHTFNYVLYGGCYSEGGTTKVSGDTHVTVETGAKFRYVYGGGAKTASAVPTVDGETYVNVTGGNVMSVFGGGYKIPSGSTNVKITGGTIDQVFGGSESASVSGNTNVQLLGGEITRRVYGGSYNDFNKNTLSWVTTDCRVIGHTNVTIGNGVKITFTSSDEDRGVFAGSRYKTAFDDEKTTVIFLDGCYTSKESLLGRDSSDYAGVVLGSPNQYDYLVDAAAGGTVTSADGILTVTPNSGYTATVEGAAVTAEGAKTYTLPTVDGTITVTFSN